MDKNKTMK